MTPRQTRHVWFHNFWKFMLPAVIGWMILGSYVCLGRTDNRQRMLAICLPMGAIGTAICLAWALPRITRALRLVRRGVLVHGKIESVSPIPATAASMARVTYSYCAAGAEMHKTCTLTRWYVDLSLAGDVLYLMMDPEDASVCVPVGYIVPDGAAGLAEVQQAALAPGVPKLAGAMTRREAARMRLGRTFLKWWMFPPISLVPLWKAFDDYWQLVEHETHGTPVRLFSIAAVGYDMFGKWGAVSIWLAMAVFLLWAGWYFRPPRSERCLPQSHEEHKAG
jgi:hypothetical protein